MSPIKIKAEFDLLIRNNDRLNALIDADLLVLESSISAQLPKIVRLFSHEQGQPESKLM